ncbi:MAG: cupin domain-containing protein [Bacteroidota bacterium]
MGKQIELKATGEIIEFTKTAADTNGAYVEYILTLPNSGEGPPPHRHILQSELFETIEGQLGLMCEGDELVLQPGESFTVPKNALHSCYAIGDEPTRCRVVFEPALNIEYLLTEIFESCNRRGSALPSPFDGSYLLTQVKGEYLLGDVPPFVQNYIFPIIALLGKLFGLVKANPVS